MSQLGHRGRVGGCSSVWPLPIYVLTFIPERDPPGMRGVASLDRQRRRMRGVSTPVVEMAANRGVGAWLVWRDCWARSPPNQPPQHLHHASLTNEQQQHDGAEHRLDPAEPVGG